MVENGSQYKVYSDGTTAWHTDGKVHRLDGPAIEYANGTKFYYQNDKRHRIDGPALDYPNGHVGWYLNDRRYTFDEFLERTPISPETKCMLKLQYG